MAENSKIEWCDHTFNPWVGCTKVSPACDNCYAEGWAIRFKHPELWNGERRRTSRANWRNMTLLNRKAKDEGVRRRVFCASLADVFDNQVPEDWRSDLWALIDACPDLDWLLLTKRPQNFQSMLPVSWGAGWPQVSLGVTAENQQELDRRGPILVMTPAHRRFLSCEPLLGPLDLRSVNIKSRATMDLLSPPIWEDGWLFWKDSMRTKAESLKGSCPLLNYAVPTGPIHARIDWVIEGGETGRNARPRHPDWSRSLQEQCAATGVPFFRKQHGDWAPLGDFAADEWTFSRADEDGRRLGTLRGGPRDNRRDILGGREFETRYPWSVGDHPGPCMVRVGKAAAGAMLDGRLCREFPV